jgi:hypothetical protein
MKRLLVILSVLTLALGNSGIAGATILTFDNISAASIGTIPDGYGSFDWDQFGFIRNDVRPGTGYDFGTVSDSYAAYNEYAHVATVSDSIFNFEGAYLTGAWNDNLNITVEGLLGNTLLYTQTVVVSRLAPTWFDFNFTGIDRLQFTSFGGTAPDPTVYSTNFVMDNFTYNVIPEPGTLLLLGLGLAGLLGYGKKRLQK